jgi:hypothetical protein
MSQKIDLPGIYAAALQAMPATIDSTPTAAGCLLVDIG